MRIRDPIHGSIEVDEAEVPVLDNPFFQRLRHVKQLGFGEMAFPGATHTRHAHSLGAMHVAARLFDSVFASLDLAASDRARLRRAVRIAALCHDLGHMPLSHASERIAPPAAGLGLPGWILIDPKARATHEELTAKLLLDSSLTAALGRALSGSGLSAPAIAGLVLGRDPSGGPPFVAGGRDFGPLLRQLVSGEVDADRMDYLLRDSFFTGVHYGHFDIDWIVQNLLPVERDGRVFLGLAKAAIFGFEDFLLSRYHMFLSVYYQHTSVNFDEMLRRYYEEAPGEFEIPADAAGFLGCDDVALTTALRASDNRWARRIVARKGYKLVAQATGLDRDYDIPALRRALTRAGIEHFATESVGVLSKYFDRGGGPPVFVVDPQTGRTTKIADYTPLYRRYASALELKRIYCLPEQAEEARAVVARAAGRKRK